MNEKSAKELILNSFIYIVKTNLQYEFVYDDENEEELQEEAENFGIEDLDKTLVHFEMTAGEFRSLLYDIDTVFGVELKEEKYWAEGKNNCLVSRKEAKNNVFIEMIAMANSDIKLRPDLTFLEIAEDLTNSAIANLGL